MTLYVPVITPFDATGAVDLGCLRSLAAGLLRDGADGLVALGTTAEPHALSPAERAAILDVLSSLGAPLVVCTADPAELTTATAALCLVPPFVRAGEDAAVAHFERLAGSLPVPVIVYHVPHRTGQPLSLDALLRIAAIPNVQAFKYAAGLDDTAVRLLASGATVYAGEDVLLAPMLTLGAAGAILASAHVATGAYAALTRGDLSGAQRLALLSAALFAAPNPSVIKAVLHAQGRIPTPDVRAPLLPASGDEALALLAPEVLAAV